MPDFIGRGEVAEFLESMTTEDEHVEAKAAANNIPKNAWESISAFANTAGGVVFFGVSETPDGYRATGVSDASRLQNDLQTGLRNRRKISHEVSDNRNIWVETIDGRDVLVLVVPEVHRSYKPVYLDGEIDHAFLRRGEADVQCDADELKRLIRESQQTTADNDVIDYLDFSDLDVEAVRRYRALCAANNSRHLRDKPTDREFLTRIGVWRHDRQTNREGLTRGGILMFGNELAIREIRANHVIDYQLKDNPDSRVRWRDRVRWTGHLFGAWEELAPRLIRNLPVPFRLSGTTRQDQPPGEETIREALINLLIHTDYQELSDARVIVTGEGFLLENPGSSRVRVEDDNYDAPEYFPPSERRNPLLSSLFSYANQAELAGSGVKSMRSEWRSLGFQVPRFQSSIQDYRFSVFLSLRSMMSATDRRWLEEIGGPWTENEEYALLIAREADHVDNQQLREISGLHSSDVTRVLQGLRDKGALVQNGYGKGTFYSLPVDVHDDGSGTGVTDARRSDSVQDTSYGHKDTSYGHRDTSYDHKGQEWEKLEKIATPVASTRRTSPDLLEETVIRLCQAASLTRADLSRLLNRSDKTVDRITASLVKQGRLRYQQQTVTSPNQRYFALPFDETMGEDE